MSRFRNDLRSLLSELNNDHQRILKAMKWYSESDSQITIDSGYSLKDKFSKIEACMNFKPYETAPKQSPNSCQLKTPDREPEIKIWELARRCYQGRDMIGFKPWVFGWQPGECIVIGEAVLEEFKRGDYADKYDENFSQWQNWKLKHVK